jgi:hypothetical protein
MYVNCGLRLRNPHFPQVLPIPQEGAMKKRLLMPHNRKRGRQEERICLGTDTALNKPACGFLLKPMNWQRNISQQMLQKTSEGILFLESRETVYGPSEMFINWVYFLSPIA